MSKFQTVLLMIVFAAGYSYGDEMEPLPFDHGSTIKVLGPKKDGDNGVCKDGKCGPESSGKNGSKRYIDDGFSLNEVSSKSEENRDLKNLKDYADKLKKAQEAGVTTVFIAFGNLPACPPCQAANLKVQSKTKGKPEVAVFDVNIYEARTNGDAGRQEIVKAFESLGGSLSLPSKFPFPHYYALRWDAEKKQWMVVDSKTIGPETSKIDNFLQKNLEPKK